MATEIAQTPFYKQTLLYKLLRRFKYLILQKKYRKDAFDKSFDWKWEDTNFNRIALVNLIVAKNQNCDYLEIGCESNALFDSVPALSKVGIDPQKGGTIRTTSDAFFQTNKALFDVVFIDGLHRYDQARRDVINSIKFLKPGGWISLHDMLPRTWIEHHVPVVSADAWTGDIWKVGFELAKTEGVDFKIIKIDRGVGVFRLTKDNPALVDLTNELNDKQFSYFYQNISKLPLVEWTECQKWLRDR